MGDIKDFFIFINVSCNYSVHHAGPRERNGK